MVYCKYRSKIRTVYTGYSLTERTNFVFILMKINTFTRRIVVISLTFVIKFVRIFQRYSTLLIKISKYRNRREICDKNGVRRENTATIIPTTRLPTTIFPEAELFTANFPRTVVNIDEWPMYLCFGSVISTKLIKIHS